MGRKRRMNGKWTIVFVVGLALITDLAPAYARRTGSKQAASDVSMRCRFFCAGPPLALISVGGDGQLSPANPACRYEVIRFALTSESATRYSVSIRGRRRGAGSTGRLETIGRRHFGARGYHEDYAADGGLVVECSQQPAEHSRQTWKFQPPVVPTSRIADEAHESGQGKSPGRQSAAPARDSH